LIYHNSVHVLNRENLMSEAFRTPVLETKLPDVGTTIFTVMSVLASKHGAVNLGQGYPDFACDPELLRAVTVAMEAGQNQYPPMAGVPLLLEAVALKIRAIYGRNYSSETEITITAGATQAILTAILAVVKTGDEVIVLEPCYDSYVPGIQLAGGVPVPVALNPGTFRPDFDKLRSAITDKTRAIIVNTPHNPSGTVWTHAEMLQLQEILAPTDIFVISDEVYEHMVYDGEQHESVARFPGLAARSFVVSSFGKTCHVTGWKVGYVAAPASLMAEFRKVHQFNVFTVNTPMQFGLASYMSDPQAYLELPAFYQKKRDLFRAGLGQTKFRLLPCEGTYFQCVDYSGLSVPERELSEADFCQWLTAEVGVAAIPLSAFYSNGFAQRMVRFCFAKKDETLRSAIARLAKL
jgi:methionine aminotransferase